MPELPKRKRDPDHSHGKRLSMVQRHAVLLVDVEGELRVDSRVLATRLQNHHKNVLELIDRYGEHFKGFGLLPFQTEAVREEGARGVKHQQFALLNEDQSYFLLSLSRNTDHVVDLKANLVAAFSTARKAAGPEAEYLPTYHALHDRVHNLAVESTNTKFVHMNFNKLINKTIGVAAGERPSLSVPRRSLMVVAQAVATYAMERANDHHDGYVLAKTAMKAIHPVAMQFASVGKTPRLT